MNAKELNFAYKIRHVLNDQLDALPVSTTERLASARKIALSRKKSETPIHVRVTRRVFAGDAGNFFNEPLSWLGRVGVATPLLIGALIFVGLYQFEQQQRIAETAEIDAAVLADDLPLSAYLDKGFNAYLAKQGE
ncbi:MAG: DUF3619 family protein [Burkholderiales bacterium]|nr:DUF3619 family protein [Burkholderiales bacterium]